jgi:predicted RNA-binding Zn-ribbon protein involved in translation (DUF1610 family)
MNLQHHFDENDLIVAYANDAPNDVPMISQICQTCNVVADADLGIAMHPCPNCRGYHYCSRRCRQQHSATHALECNQGENHGIVPTAGGGLLSAAERRQGLRLREDMERGERVADAARTVIPFLEALAPVGGYVLLTLGWEVSVPLGLSALRQIQDAAIDPALLFLLREFSWLNMPRRFRSHSKSYAVEWGRPLRSYNNTGILLQVPTEPGEFKMEFARWVDSKLEHAVGAVRPIIFLVD